MADTPKHSVSVAGIVIDERDRVLVIQRQDNGHWEPPGGVLELDETPEAGARREVAEETGIEVSVESLSGVYKNMDRGVIALVYRCTPIGGHVKSSAETRAVEWRSVDVVCQTMNEAYAVRITDALSTGVQTRSHDGVRLLHRPTSAKQEEGAT